MFEKRPYIVMISDAVRRVVDEDLLALMEIQTHDTGLLCHVHRLVLLPPVQGGLLLRFVKFTISQLRHVRASDAREARRFVLTRLILFEMFNSVGGWAYCPCFLDNFRKTSSKDGQLYIWSRALGDSSASNRPLLINPICRHRFARFTGVPLKFHVSRVGPSFLRERR